MDNSTCVILVPVGSHVEQECEQGLKQLEARGYAVRRITGYAAIDQGRSQMATDALADGFTELMWIDSDIAFDPDAVERLRAHGLPLVSGIYPKKGVRALASHLLPGTRQIVFGEGGGLIDIAYAATGFLLTRREVYDRMRQRLELPTCNTRFGRPLVPYFLPLIAPDGAGHWYLGEDFAFCERARRSGFPIVADSTIRLRHIGRYGYSWEDAGSPLPRFAQYNFHVQESAAGAAAAPATDAAAAPSMAARIPFDCCPLCGHGAATEVRIADCTRDPRYQPSVPPNVHWVACDSCGHHFADGYLDARARAGLVAAPKDAPRADAAAFSRADAARIIDGLARLVDAPAGRWLDAGSCGALVTTAAEVGYQVVALDPRPARIEELLRHGIEAHCTELAELAAAEPFDVIALADGLERIAFPKPALTRAHALLRDDGLLFVSLLNIDSLAFKTLDEATQRAHWAQVEDVHRFGRARLEALLRECGFVPCRVAASERRSASLEIVARKARPTP
jgi:methyltransferase family protein